MADICLQALKMGHRNCSDLPAILLLMLREGIAFQILLEPNCPGRADEIDESIAHIAHAAEVDWRIEEVEATSKTQAVQFLNQLLLCVPIGEIPKHHGRHWDLSSGLGGFLSEVQDFRHIAMCELLHAAAANRGACLFEEIVFLVR